MCKGACFAVCILHSAPPGFVYYIWKQTQTPKLYPFPVGGICTLIRYLMFWPYLCTSVLSPVQHCNAQHCSDLHSNSNLKIKLMTENSYKPRKWAAEILPNIAYRGPRPTHLQTMKFIRSTSKVSVCNLITLNNKINRWPVYFHTHTHTHRKPKRQKGTETRIVNDLAGVFH